MSLTRTLGFSFALMLPLTSYASFIETTIGTAVVNDATASYFNPAALVLLKQPQIIPQATFAYFHTSFNGQSTPFPAGITQFGGSTTNTNYFSPSLYLGMPIKNGISVGLAIVSNNANRNVDENSVLRYVQANNQIQDYDVVPALGIKINDCFAIGAGVNFSYAKFDVEPIIRFPGSYPVDSQSQNHSDGTGLGANAGFLIRVNPTTVFGFNYRSVTTYHLSGKSTYNGSPQIVSNNYHYLSRTPARSVASISHFFNPKLGFITTFQYIQWSIVSNLHVNGIATPLGVVNGSEPFYLRDTWSITVGGIYRYTPDCTLRVAGTYNQSPGNPRYQIVNGDNFVIGASMGYKINKSFTIDGSYAHAFLQNENININGGRYLIAGVNKGSRDAVSLKLTFNV